MEERRKEISSSGIWEWVKGAGGIGEEQKGYRKALEGGKRRYGQENMGQGRRKEWEGEKQEGVERGRSRRERGKGRRE